MYTTAKMQFLSFRKRYEFFLENPESVLLKNPALFFYRTYNKESSPIKAALYSARHARNKARKEREGGEKKVKKTLISVQ